MTEIKWLKTYKIDSQNYSKNINEELEAKWWKYFWKK